MESQKKLNIELIHQLRSNSQQLKEYENTHSLLQQQFQNSNSELEHLKSVHSQQLQQLETQILSLTQKNNELEMKVRSQELQLKNSANQYNEVVMQKSDIQNQLRSLQEKIETEGRTSFQQRESWEVQVQVNPIYLFFLYHSIYLIPRMINPNRYIFGFFYIFIRL